MTNSDSDTPQRSQANQKLRTGLSALGLDQERDGFMYIPTTYNHRKPLPFFLCLHGAGGSGGQMMTVFQELAERSEIILLAPDSRDSTWDTVLGKYGLDVDFLNKAVQMVMNQYLVDVRRVAIGGFSDGGTYAVSLGVVNGDFFTHILGFSPGFIAPTETRGAPEVFIAHGKQDAILDINRSSRQLVPTLKGLGLNVVYKEFEDGHTLPPDIVREAFYWLLGPDKAQSISESPIRSQSQGLERT